MFYIFFHFSKLIPKVQQAICMTYMFNNNRVCIICVKATMIRMTKLMTMIMEAAKSKEEVEACLPINVYILWFQNIPNFISFFTDNCINKCCEWKYRHKVPVRIKGTMPTPTVHKLWMVRKKSLYMNQVAHQAGAYLCITWSK